MTSSSVRECGGCAATQVPIAQPGDGSGRPATASNPGRTARPSGLELELVERRPARVGRAFALVVVALALDAGGERLGSRTRAVFAAERRQRQVEQQRVAHDGLEVDLVAFARADRKSVWSGKRVSVRVDLWGRR